MTAPRRPIVWLEYRHEDTAGNTVTYRWSREDLADASGYEGGWKEGRAVSIGPISRHVSDSAGEHELASASVDLDDTDALWRTLLDTDSTAYVDGRTAVIRAYSDLQRAAAGASTVLMRGMGRRLELSDGRGASIAIEDVLGSEFGPLPLDKTIPQRKFRREIFPTLHRALLEQVVPIVYGEVSDEGAIDSTGASASKGLVPGFYVGNTIVGGTGIPLGTRLQPPVLVSATVVGTPGTKTYTYGVTAFTVNGQTTLSNTITVTNAPNTLTTSNYVQLVWTQDPVYASQVTWTRVYVGDGTRTPDNKLDTMILGELTYNDDGDDSHHKGTPPPTTNTATVAGASGAEEYGRIVFADSAMHDLVGLYGSDGGANGNPVRVAWTVGAMTDVLDPTTPGWPDPNPWWDITGTDGVTERFYGIYVKGPRLQHHIDGIVTIAANLCGREETGDATGELIDQAFRVWQHLISECVLANNGDGYETGVWAGLPTFADGVAMINTDAVNAAETQSETFLGTAKGYLAAFAITQPMTVRDWIRAFNRTFTSFSYINRFGQLAISLVNTSADPTVGTTLREDIDDVIVVRAPQIETDRVENKVEYQYDWDADNQEYRSDLLAVQSSASQAAHKATRNLGPYEMFCTRDHATAVDAMGRRLALYQKAPIYIPVTTGSSGFALDLFDQVRISGIDGLGANGYVLRPAIVIGRTDRPDDGEVDLECWDLGPITGLGFGLRSGSAMTWGDWTTNSYTWADWSSSSVQWG
jgi:hypothetical protein